jgi:hypothetical protein
MTAKARKPPEGGTLSEYIERWENEGGAPECGNRSRKKRPRVANRPAKSMADIETGEAEKKGAVANNPVAASLDRRGVHSAGDRSRMAETGPGSIHASAVTLQRQAPNQYSMTFARRGEKCRGAIGERTPTCLAHWRSHAVCG